MSIQSGSLLLRGARLGRACLFYAVGPADSSHISDIDQPMERGFNSGSCHPPRLLIRAEVRHIDSFDALSCPDDGFMAIPLIRRRYRGVHPPHQSRVRTQAATGKSFGSANRPPSPTRTPDTVWNEPDCVIVIVPMMVVEVLGPRAAVTVMGGGLELP